MKWVNASEIEAWADRHEKQAQQLFPELIKRLVLAHQSLKTDIDFIEFPSGDSVRKPGFDGKLKLKNTPKIAYIPDIQTIWEMGVGKSPKEKADDDYTKRKTNTLGFASKETVFIFATTRSFPIKEVWCEEKKKDGFWKDVIALDRDTLENWLEVTPSVALWFAKLIGKAPSSGVVDMSTWWDNWNSQTRYPLSSELVINCRQEAVDNVKNWLENPPSTVIVKGELPDEAIAILKATIDEYKEDEQIEFLSKMLIIKSKEAMEHCISTFSNPLILVLAEPESVSLAASAIRKGHHVFIPSDQSLLATEDGNVIELSRLNRELLREHLVKIGVSEAEAKKLKSDSGGSLSILHRAIRVTPTQKPVWAAEPYAKIMRTILIAGSWDESKEEDKSIIEYLYGESYSSFQTKLHELECLDDTPIRRINTLWVLKSHRDAMNVCEHLIGDAEIEKVKHAALTVLGEQDPKYTLEEDKRYMAAIYDKVRKHSSFLRTGISQTLVLLSLEDSRQQIINRILRELLGGVKSTEQLASLGDILPLLSEASPESFLTFLEKDTNENPEVYKTLMCDNQGGVLFGGCDHSGLLWALENTGWSSETFPATSRILFRLSQLDEGGQWANRPISSLSDIFRVAYPKTYANVEDRIGMLEHFFSIDSVTTWKVVESLLNKNILSETHRYKWRRYESERTDFEQEDIEDIVRFQKAFFELVKKLVLDPDVLPMALEEIPQLPEEISSLLVEELKKMDAMTLSKTRLEELRELVRNWISLLDRPVEKGQYVSLIPDLEQIYGQLEPSLPTEKHRWLFNTAWPRSRVGIGAYDKLPEERKHAMEEVYTASGDISSVIDFCLSVDCVYLAASSFAKVVDRSDDQQVLSHIIGSQDAKAREFVISYTDTRIDQQGVDWWKAVRPFVVSTLSGKELTDTIVSFYLGLPLTMETWKLLEKEETEVQQGYWRKNRGVPRGLEGEDGEYAVEKLIDVDRPFDALPIAGIEKANMPSNLLVKLLKKIIAYTPKQPDEKLQIDTMGSYYIENIFKKLHKANLPIQDIAHLEWAFARILIRASEKSSFPLKLHELLASEPSFFLQLVSILYKRDEFTDNDRDVDEEETKAEEGAKDENKELMIGNAYNVLRAWKTLPGQSVDGKELNVDILNSWIKEARKICKEAGYIKGCDLALGGMLSASPIGADGIWPHEGVRKVIEETCSDVLDKHISTGVINSRGVVSRSVGEGGEQERTLFKRYKEAADKLRISFPRTSSILSDIAAHYSWSADHEDADRDVMDHVYG